MQNYSKGRKLGAFGAAVILAALASGCGSRKEPYKNRQKEMEAPAAASQRPITDGFYKEPDGFYMTPDRKASCAVIDGRIVLCTDKRNGDQRYTSTTNGLVGYFGTGRVDDRNSISVVSLKYYDEQKRAGKDVTRLVVRGSKAADSKQRDFDGIFKDVVRPEHRVPGFGDQEPYIVKPGTWR